MRYVELTLAAQSAYAELAEETRTFEMTAALSGLVGSFHKLARRGRAYWYFGYRDLGGKSRMVYVGPDDDRVRALVERFATTRRAKPLAPAAQAALAHGCAAAVPKHFRVVKRLAEYGFFRAGGVLIGAHAFLALGNLLGVRWTDGASTLDVDFAHAGRSLSIALPADLAVDVHGALESLEMGLLPMTTLDGEFAAQYRNPGDPELRLDFVTSRTRGDRLVEAQNLGIGLQPLKFMEFLLEGTTQACFIGRVGACTVNVPAPERFAVHKLIVHGERPPSERTKARKDLLQAACIADWCLRNQHAANFNRAWRDALDRGRGWSTRALAGQKALLAIAPDVAADPLWRRR